jgi:hypothetical protein
MLLFSLARWGWKGQHGSFAIDVFRFPGGFSAHRLSSPDDGIAELSRACGFSGIVVDFFGWIPERC